jgi:hypothetical protein
MILILFEKKFSPQPPFQPMQSSSLAKSQAPPPSSFESFWVMFLLLQANDVFAPLAHVFLKNNQIHDASLVCVSLQCSCFKL